MTRSRREILMEEKIRTLRKDRNVKRREKEIGKENPHKNRRNIELQQEKLRRKRRHHQKEKMKYSKR